MRWFCPNCHRYRRAYVCWKCGIPAPRLEDSNV